MNPPSGQRGEAFNVCLNSHSNRYQGNLFTGTAAPGDLCLLFSGASSQHARPTKLGYLGMQQTQDVSTARTLCSTVKGARSRTWVSNWPVPPAEAGMASFQGKRRACEVMRCQNLINNDRCGAKSDSIGKSDLCKRSNNFKTCFS